jgi:hypothetical protein
MERLTNDTLKNAISVYETTIKACEEDEDEDYCPILDKATVSFLKELQEYRNLEEQGLLLRLPCKVGTKVYYVQKCLARSCKNCMGFTRVNNCYTEYKSRIFEQEFSLRHLKAFGKTVFLTKAEAEKKLAEMGE